jgi:hypothetical protein
MSALLRMLAAGGLVYAGFAVAFPDGQGTVWNAMTMAFIAGGAVGVFFLHKILDLGEGAAKLALELGFVVAVVLWVGYTMPQKRGKPPLTQWAEGVRPRRDDARRGVKRLGLDPDGAVAGRIVDLFPR